MKKNSKHSESNSKNFEISLNELEEVVSQLEKGDLSLDNALELFERGIQLSRTCKQQLETAERRVEILIKGLDDTCTSVPFETEI